MRSTVITTALTTVLCFCVLGTSASRAQDPTAPTTANSAPAQGGQYGHHGPMSPDEELAHLTKALNLSSDQQTQVKPILQDRHDQLMQLHQDASLSRESRGSKMKSLDDESNSKLEAVLNGQQKAKYDKMVADRKARMAEMRSRHVNGSEASTNDSQPQ